MQNDSRLLCSDLVAVEWYPTSGESHETTAVLDDISKRGACLLLEHPIPAETMIKLICGRCELKGKVRSCRYRDGIGYHVGIAFAEENSWSKEHYEPLHFLDPNNLIQIQPAGCISTPPCQDGQPCPHDCVTEAASGGDPAEKIRQVAREVARVCRNLDVSHVRTCYQHLYDGRKGGELLGEFVEAYYEELAVAKASDETQRRGREVDAKPSARGESEPRNRSAIEK